MSYGDKTRKKEAPKGVTGQSAILEEEGKMADMNKAGALPLFTEPTMHSNAPTQGNAERRDVALAGKPRLDVIPPGAEALAVLMSTMPPLNISGPAQDEVAELAKHQPEPLALYLGLWRELYARHQQGIGIGLGQDRIEGHGAESRRLGPDTRSVDGRHGLTLVGIDGQTRRTKIGQSDEAEGASGVDREQT